MVNDVTSGEPQEEQPINWDEHEPVPGLEHLGRAIVDEAGIPSGSPANYENTRGIRSNIPLPNVADIVTAINSDFDALLNPPEPVQPPPTPPEE